MRIMPGYCVGVKGASPAASMSGKPRGEFGGELVRLVSIGTVPKVVLTKQETSVSLAIPRAGQGRRLRDQRVFSEAIQTPGRQRVSLSGPCPMYCPTATVTSDLTSCGSSVAIR